MKDNVKEVLTKRNSFLGYHIADLIGIFLMIFPCYIVLRDFGPGKSLIPWLSRSVNLKPCMKTALLAVAFYIPFLLRYDMFRVSNLLDIIITIVRSFLDCLVIAGLMTIVVPNKNSPIPPLFIFGVVSSWLGMKTIAGYSWILFVIPAWSRLSTISKRMDVTGAVFIIMMSLAFLLQLCTYTDLKDLLEEFGGIASKFSSNIKEEVNAATQDATQKAEFAANYVKKKMGVNTAESRAKPELKKEKSENEIQVNFKSLDVNNDGVIDEKDFAILAKSRGKDENLQ